MADIGPGDLGDFSDLSRPGAFGGSDGRGDPAGSGEGDGGRSLEADRTAAIERLKRHAGPGGALAAEDLADRVRRVYLARARVGIEQVLADLPADPPWAVTPGLPPAPGHVPALRVRRAASPWRTAGFVLGALALVAGVGGAIVASSPDSDGDHESAAEVPERELPASTLPPIAVPDAPPSTPPPATTTTVVPPAGDPALPFAEPAFVLQKVGEDIAPGRYLSTPEILCYWERVKGFGGTLDDAIANGGSFTGRHVIVDVLPGDAGLRSQGCDFRPYTPPAAPATTIADGDWLVGSDVAAGTYRLGDGASAPTGDTSMCAWERSTNFTHGYDGVIDYAFPAGDRLTVELGAGERFTSIDCGTWTRI